MEECEFSIIGIDKQFQQLVVYHWDMEEAKKYTEILLQRFDKGSDTLNRALILGAIISYARPFSNNKGVNIPNGVIREFNPSEKKLHQTINGVDGIRNTLFAHSDSHAHQIDSSIYKVNGEKLAIPFCHDPYFPFSKDQVLMLLSMITEIQSQLSDRRIEIQNKYTK